MITKKLTACLLSAVLAVAALPRAWAGLAPAHEAAAVSGASAVDAAALERRMVQDKLVRLGVAPEEARAQLAQLSDRDVHALATNPEALRPGGAWELALAIAGGVLLFVLLINLIHAATPDHDHD